ncbi:hypothetical protein ATCC90586_003176 [Pythium insidiosum]|nr:hypothetical protein ATCC90586_003176 [Pythium insidiosum]
MASARHESRKKHDDAAAAAVAGPLELGSTRGMTTYLFNNAQDDDAMLWTNKTAVPVAGNGPTLLVELSARRFLLVIGSAVVVLVAILLLFVRGITIRPHVEDELGSTKNANDIVEHYQTINGYVTAAIGEGIETVFEIFAAVAVTYLTNVALYPSDNPDRPPAGIKRWLLIAFVPVLMFLLNVAISAAFVQHTNVDVLRVFLPGDLIAKQLSVTAPPATNGSAVTNASEVVKVQDTILRAALRKRHVPFELDADSKCVASEEGSTASSDEEEMPSVREVRSTTVVYGFPSHDWNLDALPTNLRPTHQIKFQMNESVEEVDAAFAKFQKAADVSWLTTYEMFLQGKLLFERSVSDANVSAEYPCTWVDGLAELDPKNLLNSTDAATNGSAPTSAPPSGTTRPPTSAPPTSRPPSRRRLDATPGADDVAFEDEEWEEDEDELPVFDEFEEGPYKGMRRCYGAISTLQHLDNITDPSMHSATMFVGTIINGFNETMPSIDPLEMELTIETFQLNPQMKLTAMTIDIPYAEGVQYRDVRDYCDKSGGQLKKEIAAEVFTNTSTPDEKEAVRAMLCDQRNYPYTSPKTTCGSHNCIFLDKSGTLPFKKQLQLIPYQTNCTTANMEYKVDFHSYFPTHCKPQHDAVFLYGLGTYMSGDYYDSGLNDDAPMPMLVNSKRHVVLTFAKLEWKLEELHKKFNAQCSVPEGCHGLLHKLENVTVPRITPNKTVKDTYLRVLLVGNASLPAERMTKDFRNPVQLVNLNTRPFYYEKEKRYFEWEYLNLKRFKEHTWPTGGPDAPGLNGSACSLMVDSYLRQIETNHYYLEEPLQPLYTAAFYYLFQDAALKSVKLTKNATTGAEVMSLSYLGSTNLKGDLEKKEIKFSIPLLSLISTFVGLACLLLLVVLAIVCPTERLKKSHITNVAEKYADVLMDDQYPDEVCGRRLLLPTGERVNMDDFAVESITFHHTRDDDTKVYL